MMTELQIEVAVVPDALLLPPLQVEGCGAVVRFEGKVRDEEAGQKISALFYEAYEPMAGKVMKSLLKKLGQEYRCVHARVLHRTGRVPVGECAIVMEAHAKHRAEALRLVEEFLNRLKQEVPIWKSGAEFCRVEESEEP
jgi:molybdopterin synthase catalytic subunit